MRPIVYRRARFKCSLQLYKHLRFVFEIIKDVPEEQGVEIAQNKNND